MKLTYPLIFSFSSSTVSLIYELLCMSLHKKKVTQVKVRDCSRCEPLITVLSFKEVQSAATLFYLLPFLHYDTKASPAAFPLRVFLFCFRPKCPCKTFHILRLEFSLNGRCFV